MSAYPAPSYDPNIIFNPNYFIQSTTEGLTIGEGDDRYIKRNSGVANTRTTFIGGLQSSSTIETDTIDDNGAGNITLSSNLLGSVSLGSSGTPFVNAYITDLLTNNISTISGDLTINDNTTISGDLDITGALTFTGGIDTNEITAPGGTLTINGNVETADNITCSQLFVDDLFSNTGSSVFMNNVLDMNNNTLTDGSGLGLDIGTDTNITGTLSVSDSIVVKDGSSAGSIVASGNSSTQINLNSTADIIELINGTRGISFNTSEFRPFLSDDGLLDLGGSTSRWNNVYSEAGNFSGAVDIGGVLSVDNIEDNGAGLITFNGVDVNTTLIIDNSTTLYPTLTSTTNNSGTTLQLASAGSVDVVIDSNSTLGGDDSFRIRKNTLNGTGTELFRIRDNSGANSCSITGNTDITGDLDVTGTLTAGSISGGLDLSGTLLVDTIDDNGAGDITCNTDFTIPTGNNLVLDSIELRQQTDLEGYEALTISRNVASNNVIYLRAFEPNPATNPAHSIRFYNNDTNNSGVSGYMAGIETRTLTNGSSIANLKFLVADPNYSGVDSNNLAEKLVLTPDGADITGDLDVTGTLTAGSISGGVDLTGTLSVDTIDDNGAGTITINAPVDFTQKPIFIVETSGGTSVPDATETKIQGYGTPLVNENFTSFSSGVLTVARDGVYNINYQMNYPAGNSTGFYQGQITINGSNDIGKSKVPAFAGGINLNGSVLVELSATDTIEIQAFHSAGTSLTVGADLNVFLVN